MKEIESSGCHGGFCNRPQMCKKTSQNHPRQGQNELNLKILFKLEYISSFRPFLQYINVLEAILPFPMSYFVILIYRSYLSRFAFVPRDSGMRIVQHTFKKSGNESKSLKMREFIYLIFIYFLQKFQLIANFFVQLTKVRFS